MSAVKNIVWINIILVLMFAAAFFLWAEEGEGNEIVYRQTFGQKAGMLPQGSHSFYIRTNDEFTGFSTLFLGYRYGLSDYFQFAVEAGVGIQVYIASLVLHLKIYESPSHRFFMGIRNRSGYKYQDTRIKLGDALLDDERNGFYIATDFTLAWRVGEKKRLAFYYTIYPLFDIDITGRPVEIYLAPVHLGLEFIFKRNPRWSFAFETGYFFAVNDVPDTSWFNFPNLANIGFYYRSGN